MARISVLYFCSCENKYLFFKLIELRIRNEVLLHKVSFQIRPIL